MAIWTSIILAMVVYIQLERENRSLRKRGKSERRESEMFPRDRDKVRLLPLGDFVSVR